MDFHNVPLLFHPDVFSPPYDKCVTKDNFIINILSLISKAIYLITHGIGNCQYMYGLM
jgi:hypothetical protein